MDDDIRLREIALEQAVRLLEDIALHEAIQMLEKQGDSEKIDAVVSAAERFYDFLTGKGGA